MKRRLAIFLMLWLPLFMQSAWAMSTRMLLQGTAALATQQTADATAMPCHMGMMPAEMAAMSHMEKSHGHTPANHEHTQCHQCVACAVASASASFNAMPQWHLPAGVHVVSTRLEISYHSIHLPSEVKPPISA